MKLQVQMVKACGLLNVELPGQTSDPYVVCETSGHKIKTKVINSDLNPIWDFTGEIEWDGTSDLVFTLYDSNAVRGDAYMGSFILPKTKVGFGFKGVVDLTVEHAKGKHGGTLEIRVSPSTTPLVSRASIKREDLHSLVMDNPFLMWHSVPKSAAVLGAVNAVFVIYSSFDIQLTSLLSNLLVLVILLGGASRLAGVQLTEEDIGLVAVEEAVRKLAMSLAQSICEAMHLAQIVVIWQDQTSSLAVLLGLYFLNGVSRWVDVTVLIFLVFNALFVVPVNYKKHEKIITDKVKPQLAKLMAHKDKVVSKVPKFSSLGIKED